jgi:hypothetical protein
MSQQRDTDDISTQQITQLHAEISTYWSLHQEVIATNRDETG